MVISGQLKGFGNANEYFKIGDVIGVGIIHSTANTSLKCFATLNGKLLGNKIIFKNMYNISYLCRNNRIVP